MIIDFNQATLFLSLGIRHCLKCPGIRGTTTETAPKAAGSVFSYRIRPRQYPWCAETVSNTELTISLANKVWRLEVLAEAKSWRMRNKRPPATSLWGQMVKFSGEIRMDLYFLFINKKKNRESYFLLFTSIFGCLAILGQAKWLAHLMYQMPILPLV